jgi:hypothetical protein
MRFSTSCLAASALAFLSFVSCSDPTDTYRDADIEQSGYLPNHNMDPAVVNSPQFGLLWKIPFNSQEAVSQLSTQLLGDTPSIN